MNAKFFYRSVDLINSVSKKIVANNLIKKKDRVLVSFSGGQDSICLLFLLNQLYSQMELNLALFWCHHLWQTDAFSLMQQSAKLSFLFQFNNCFAIPSNILSSELLARKWRYDCSYRVSSFYNHSKICLAHTSNDKVETLFLNLMRGTGLRGLSPLRWIQFVPKNNIKKEEHISQIFPAQISPFFWYFLFDKCFSKKKQIFGETSTNGWNKFWIKKRFAKKFKTFFLFCWKPNIYSGTTNLTKLSFFSTLYLCLSPLYSKSINFNAKLSASPYPMGTQRIIRRSFATDNKPMTFCCSSFERGGTNFSFPKISFFQDISPTANYSVRLSIENLSFRKNRGEDKNFIFNSILIIENEHSIFSINTFFTPTGYYVDNSIPLSLCTLKKVVLKKDIRKLRIREKISINSIDFLQSELCNDNKSLQSELCNDNKSIDFYAKQIRRSFATDKDKSSLQSESINFYAKQIRRSFATDNSFAYPRRGKEMHGALHDNKSYSNTKKKKNRKAKKWFKCVSYTFFKACSTHLAEGNSALM